MKPVIVLSLVAFAVALVGGCATAEDSKNVAEPKAPRHYRTGSNIPVKEAERPPMTEEERQRAVESMRRAGRPIPPTN